MSLDEATAAFITEGRELLQSMEEALLNLEHSHADPDAINAVFRAAHTIKGSAGIFGLDDIVAFTHVAESVLDKVRSGQLPIDRGLCGLLLKAGDHVLNLIQCVEVDQKPTADVLQNGKHLIQELNRYLGDGLATGPDPVKPEARQAQEQQERTPRHWHLSIRFGGCTFMDGFDPLSFIRYLSTFGTLTRVITVLERIPVLSELVPDECHLGFEIEFETSEDRDRIESVFEFVRQDSLILILEPGASEQDVSRHMLELPESREYLTDLFAQCGIVLNDAPSVDANTSPNGIGQTRLTPSSTAGSMEPKLLEAREPGARANPDRKAESQALRVEASKLDELISLVGELIIAGAGTSLMARKHRIKEMVQATSALTRLMEEVRDTALNLRMLPIGGTFNRFQRVVRDVSQELGKDIHLHITGGETEIDKTVIEKLADPLTHLVRNAIDHGIENADVRAQAGKSAQGTVHLNAYHEAGSVIVEVSDDGGGLKRERIIRKALEKGLISEGSNLKDSEVYALIFEPGFSTAEQVSNLSGRGVGMDVVKRSIVALRGSIAIDSQEGVGTKVTIRLPLTLAIIDGFLIGVGPSSYVVPLDLVVECIELRKGLSDKQDWLDLRGEVLPLIRLKDLHGVRCPPSRRQNVVVVRSGTTRVGLVVEQLHGELQTVIKPLGKVFNNVPGVSGFTILGAGTVALLLDVPGLVRQATQMQSHPASVNATASLTAD